MSLAAEFLLMPLDLLDDFGSTATYVVPAGVDDDGGEVTEDPTETEVRLFGPLDDVATDGMKGANARFVVPASGFAITPVPGHRIVQAGRTWLVNAVENAAVAGVTIAWNLACGEQVLA